MDVGIKLFLGCGDGNLAIQQADGWATAVEDLS